MTLGGIFYSIFATNKKKGGEMMNTVFNGLDTSNRIKGILASRGKTQVELGRLLGLTPETISARMKYNKWDVEELKKIAVEFGIETADLI